MFDPQEIKALLKGIMIAAATGSLAAIEATEKASGEPTALLVIAAPDPSGKGVFIQPFARLFNSPGEAGELYQLPADAKKRSREEIEQALQENARRSPFPGLGNKLDA